MSNAAGLTTTIGSPDFMGRDCTRFWDSPKSASGLAMTVGVSGSIKTEDGGLFDTVTYSTTTRNLSLTRVPFDARAYYTDGTRPGENKFQLVSPCCCWKCRFGIIYDESEDVFDPGFSFPWILTYGNGDPSDNGETPVDADFGNAFAPDSRELLCQRADEAGRVGQSSSFRAQAVWQEPPGFSMPPLDWVYVDSVGGSDSGSGATEIGFPSRALVMPSCNDAMTWNASITFNGSVPAGPFVFSVTNFKIDASFALT